MKKNETFPIEIDNGTTGNSTSAKNEMLNFMYRNEAKMYTLWWDNSGYSNVIRTQNYRRMRQTM